ncbi:ABC-type dipeptide/oligopeptide/nickel transport system, permease component [Fervidobacterium pennivorans DSM 9078]|uniref:ABC-type dipeptide/oligopeptide/nickel transport system, permease component n=1 Tax=Fervidobacterium pennivorans (strain DSM 9078 / Ven5) TaxID=771875 RepID=H9UBB8_FERPD|nr:ABC-type dipeptide/oligopeptide/nickel transport system, permease component [Fervidobacterium pennivorans DSM 9078]
MWVLIIMYIAMIFADFLAPYNPFQQNLNHSLKKPTTVKMSYKAGDFKATLSPYVLPEISYIDIDYSQKFKQLLFPSRIRVRLKDGTEFDIIDKNVVEVKDGKIIPKYLPKGRQLSEKFVIAEGIKLVINDKRDALVKDLYSGEEEWKTFKEEEVEKDFLVFTVDDEALAKGEVIVETRSRTARSIVAQNEAWRIGVWATDEQEAMEIVQAVRLDWKLKGIKYIGEDGEEYYIDMTEAKVVNYDYKYYPVKWFVKSWGPDKTDPGRVGYLFWVIPLHYHLFGVDNYDNNEYVTLNIFGSDRFGRDMWSRIIFASRISLSVGFIGLSITMLLALFFGGIAGYYGGWLDEGLMRFSEILMSMPGFYLLLLLRSVLPIDLPSSTTYLLIVFILSFISWPGRARTVRGMFLAERQREYVEAAIALGYPDMKVIWSHIIPNLMTYLIVSATLSIPGYILGESGLSFLGLGIREPSPSWGNMISAAQDVYILTNAPWLLIPGVFIFFTVLCFNFVGDGLRDAFDPRTLG